MAPKLYGDLCGKTNDVEIVDNKLKLLMFEETAFLLCLVNFFAIIFYKFIWFINIFKLFKNFYTYYLFMFLIHNHELLKSLIARNQNRFFVYQLALPL